MGVVARAFAGRVHYAWVVVAAIFIVMLAGAATRAAPSVLIVPLEQAFGWSRATISIAIALSIALYGLIGPFAVALMQQIGIRRTLALALCLISAATASSTMMTQAWQFVVTWGLLVGLGCGVVAMVLGATVVNRWFVARRGVAIGLLTASSATGQLIFLPSFAALAGTHGWQAVAWLVAAVTIGLVPVVLLIVRERPGDVGLRAYGATEADPPPNPSTNPILRALGILGTATRSRDFWILFGSFFVCGLSTNGLIGTHLISACLDHGIPEVHAASLLAMMGVFDLIGTTASGWLSDRYDNRWLLFWYYGLRGLSLLYLPYSNYDLMGLSIFAVFYGLDWIATVPPTVRLTTDAFGKEDAPVVFGWLLAGHQLGGAVAALGAGTLRTLLGGYLEAFLIAGIFCVLTAVMVLGVGRGGRRPALVEAPA
jgi:sugar phosphate permease